MNLTSGEKLFHDFVKKWNEKKLEDEIEISKLLTSNTLHPIAFSRNFAATVQPILSVLYLIFALFMLYVFIKNTMTGFVNCLIMLCSFISIVPAVLIAPIIVVFFNFVDENVPIPYPWCYLYVTIGTSMSPIAQTTSLYLKVLLGINRVCSVYRPFDTKIWFTKSRSTMYCLLTCGVCIAVGSVLHFSYNKVVVKRHFDVIWGSARHYNACSMAPMDATEHQMTFLYVSQAVHLGLHMIGLMCMVVCNILLVVKLRLVISRRKKLIEFRTKVIKQNDSRLYLLNSISSWVITTSSITEIPSLTSKAMAFYGMVYFAITGTADTVGTMGESRNPGQVTFYVFYYIDLVILAPLDLVIFVIMSKKTKNAMKEILCVCKRGDDNENQGIEETSYAATRTKGLMELNK